MGERYDKDAECRIEGLSGERDSDDATEETDSFEEPKLNHRWNKNASESKAFPTETEGDTCSEKGSDDVEEASNPKAESTSCSVEESQSSLDRSEDPRVLIEQLKKEKYVPKAFSGWKKRIE